jgi:hypothetical protein
MLLLPPISGWLLTLWYHYSSAVSLVQLYKHRQHPKQHHKQHKHHQHHPKSISAAALTAASASARLALSSSSLVITPFLSLATLAVVLVFGLQQDLC